MTTNLRKSEVLGRDFSDAFYIDRNVVFLNSAAFGVTLRVALEEHHRLQHQLEAQPVAFFEKCVEKMGEARRYLASFLGTKPDNLVYITNVTFGINLLSRSIKLSENDEVLTTHHEFREMHQVWRFAAAKFGFRYVVENISCPMRSPEDFLEDFFSKVTKRTKVIFLSHVSSPTALLFPVKEVCARAREMGILTIIDGAHTPGHVPLDLDEMGADFYVGNLHKWLGAPLGSAFLYVAPAMQESLEPLVVSWGWQSDTPSSSTFIDQHEWLGTRDITAFLATPSAINFQQSNSWDDVIEHCHQLARHTEEEVLRITKMPSLHVGSPEGRIQMFAATLPPDVNLVKLKDALRVKYQIEVDLYTWKDSPMIRASFQAYNTWRDVDALVEALRHLIG